MNVEVSATKALVDSNHITTVGKSIKSFYPKDETSDEIIRHLPQHGHQLYPTKGELLGYGTAGAAEPLRTVLA